MTTRSSFLTDVYGEKLAVLFSRQIPGNNVRCGQTAVDHVMKFDPSRGEKYSTWLVQSLLSDGMLADDLPKAKETLELFHANKHRLQKQHRDIGSHQSLAELWKVVKPFANPKVPDQSATGKERRRRKKDAAHKESVILLDEDDWTVAVPMTEDAAKWWGRGTRWCTSSDNDNVFDEYHQKAPLIVVDLKKHGKLQLWVPDSENPQFTDADDAKVSKEFIELHLDRLLPLLKWAVSQNSISLALIPEEYRSREICLQAVKQSGKALEHVPEEFRSIDIYLEAVRSFGNALPQVPHASRTPEVLYAALAKNPWMIQHVPETLCDEKHYIDAVSRQGNALEFIPQSRLTPDICLAATKKTGWSLRLVPEDLRSYEVCLEAVRQDSRALQHVPETLRTREMCLDAVSGCGFSLKYVPMALRDAEICMTALKNTDNAMHFIPRNQRTPEIKKVWDDHHKIPGFLRASNSPPISRRIEKPAYQWIEDGLLNDLQETLQTAFESTSTPLTP